VTRSAHKGTYVILLSACLLILGTKVLRPGPQPDPNRTYGACLHVIVDETAARGLPDLTDVGDGLLRVSFPDGVTVTYSRFGSLCIEEARLFPGKMPTSPSAPKVRGKKVRERKNFS
jgi:hypothetical protein